MADPEATSLATASVVAEEAATGRKTGLSPEGKRSISDERRFRDILEDDEVRQVLRARHADTSSPRSG